MAAAQSPSDIPPGPPSFLEVLPEIGRDQVLGVARRRTYARQDVVVRQGDQASSLYLVESGSLAVRLMTPVGDAVLLTVMGAGDVFGEVGLLMDRQERTATIEAIDDVVAHVLRREDFDRLRRRHPEVNDFLLVLLARRTDRLSRLVAEAHYLPVDKRVARRLLETGRHFSRGVLPVVVPLTQDDLAQMAGTTRPTTNQALKKLEADGVIRLARGRVEILGVAALRERCR
jgi:CRP-like cAMP-binding protein